MFYKIYYGNKPLYLCNEIDDTIQPLVHHEDSIFIDELNSHAINTLMYELQQPAVHAIILFHPDLEELKTEVFKKFKLIRAGGGLVINAKNEILLIFRRGKWDLPKGKLDPGETIEDCAIREVMEETGLSAVKITKPLLTTWHIYQEGTKWVLKQTDWFSMKITENSTLIPQSEEDITAIEWVSKNKLGSYQKNTFPSVKEVLALL